MSDMNLAVIVDDSAPIGLAANAAAICTMAMSNKVGLLGRDVKDGDGVIHAGITRYSVRLLEAANEALKSIHERASSLPDVVVTDVPTIAQAVHDNYDGYAAALEVASGDAIQYAAVAVFGPRKTINKLTGSLRLFGKAAAKANC